MEEAAAVRRAASEATADVVPEELRDTIDDYVADGSVVPGVVTLLSARLTGANPEELLEQAAGVQLIYAGLRLTRELAQANPWRDAPGGANMDVLAADVLVSRGFYLLARTEAAEDAVGVVRAFGRDQTDRETADPERAEALDRNLEADVLELAVTAGVTAAGGRADGASAIAAELAPDDDNFDPAEAFLDADARDRLAGLSSDSGRPLNRND